MSQLALQLAPREGARALPAPPPAAGRQPPVDDQGRQAVLEEGLRCRAWGHPDYPPAQVRAYLRRRFGEPREGAGS